MRRLKASNDKRPNNARRTNCRIEKTDVEKEYKKASGSKIKKPVETQVTTRVCDLVQELESASIAANQDPSMICVNKESFQSVLDKVDLLITKLFDDVYPEMNEESRRERQSKVFGDAWTEMMRLSNGIAEDKKKKKKEPKYKGCKGNPRHRSRDTSAGKAGTFMSDDDIKKGKKGSASFWYSCRDKLGRVGLKGKKHRWIKDPDKCGRSSKDNPRRKCSDFKEEKELIPESLKTRWKEMIESPESMS
jgi:hypothetical protein|tara:strand:+ start:178 stop:921 length:744 start_codon:yes stop_codon:yes gene_type:complete